MFPLRCTVRGCGQPLNASDGSLRCPRGHHFDRARQGYWNLLQPQDRRSRRPGDAEAAVLARSRWIARGKMSGLAGALRPWVDAARPRKADRPPATLELGCGEGTLGRELFAAEAGGYCGIDLSKAAIKLAARGWPEATWVLANADRVLPAADASVDRVVSLFGRRPAAEIRRVLAPDGRLIVAVPGDDDLIELRARVQQTGRRRDRREGVIRTLESAGLEHLATDRWGIRERLDPDAIADALAMTYRAARHSERDRAAVMEATDVTLSADLLLFRPAA